MKSFYSFPKLLAFAKEFRFTITDQALYLSDSKGLIIIRTPDTDLVERLKSADRKAVPHDALHAVFAKYIDGDAKLFPFRDTGIILPQDKDAYRVYTTDDAEGGCIKTCKLINRSASDIFSPVIINGAWDIKQPLVLSADESGENAALISPFVVRNPSDNFREFIRDIRYVSDIFSHYSD